MEKLENYSNFNENKRLVLIKSYFTSERFTEESNGTNLASEFEKFIFSSKSPYLIGKYDDNLIETTIRYSLLYLEEFNYDLKMKGLYILDHLITNVSSAQLNFNLRSKLIYENLERYVNEKENLDFMNMSNKIMCKLLIVIQSKNTCSEHGFKQHSVVIDSMLTNCYMTTNAAAKLVYFENLIHYLKQIGSYSSRHLDKLLTNAFDPVDNSQISLDLVHQERLLIRSLNLIKCVVEICPLRVHAHAKRIINFLLRLLYLTSQTSNEGANNLENFDFINQITNLLNQLFQNELIKKRHYDEFLELQKNPNFNETFLKLIQGV